MGRSKRFITVARSLKGEKGIVVTSKFMTKLVRALLHARGDRTCLLNKFVEYRFRPGKSEGERVGQFSADRPGFTGRNTRGVENLPIHQPQALLGSTVV